jgi:SPP1 gp7 family putative phage head morphogenesis protein
MRYPASAEVAYRAALRRLVEDLGGLLRSELDANGQAIIDMAALNRNDDDSPIRPTGWVDLLIQLLARVASGVITSQRRAEAAMAALSGRTSDINLREWRELVRSSYGVDILRGEPWLAEQLSAWEQVNLGLIQSVPQNVVDQLRTQMTQAVSQGTSLRSLKTIVRERLGVADSRAELIARDQIAKLNADLTQRRQTAIGVTSYVWRTMGDERVRESHRSHNGKAYRWDKPPAGTGHPGHDVRCRCYADPVLPEMTEAEVQLLG